MTEKQLKNLSRMDLLELLLEQTRRADELQAHVDELTARVEELQSSLDAREITNISGTGTLAEAAMQINGVFEAADKAAKQYLMNLEAMDDKKRAEYNAILTDARARSVEMLRKTYAHCNELIRSAQGEAGSSPEDDSFSLQEDLTGRYATIEDFSAHEDSLLTQDAPSSSSLTEFVF